VKATLYTYERVRVLTGVPEPSSEPIVVAVPYGTPEHRARTIAHEKVRHQYALHLLMEETIEVPARAVSAA